MNDCLNPTTFKTITIDGRSFRVNPIRLEDKTINSTKLIKTTSRDIIFSQLEKYDKSSSEPETDSYSDIEDEDHLEMNTEKINDKYVPDEYLKSKNKEVMIEKNQIVVENTLDKGEKIKVDSNNNNAKTNFKNTKRLYEVLSNNIISSKYSVIFELSDSNFSKKLDIFNKTLKTELIIEKDDCFFYEKSNILINILEIDKNEQEISNFCNKIKDFIKNSEKEESEQGVSDITGVVKQQEKGLNLELEIIDYIEGKNINNANHGYSVVIRPRINNPLSEYYIDFIDSLIQKLLEENLITKNDLKNNNYNFDQLTQRYEPKHINCFLFDCSVNRNLSLKNKVEESVKNNSEYFTSEEIELLTNGFNGPKLVKAFKSFGGLGMVKLEKLSVINNLSKEKLVQIKI